MKALIRYHQLENGIHEIVFMAKTLASVDEFYETIQVIYDRLEPKMTVRLLVDLSLPGTIPMQYMFQKGQTWRRNNPNNLPVRALILYPERGILPIARVFINAILQVRQAQTRIRLESIVKREEAVQWLLGDKS